MISLETFEDQWLEDIRAGDPSTTLLGNRFAQKMLRDWHEIDDATAEIVLCDGSGDGGIDAAVFMKADPDEGIEGDSWLLIQSKYGSAFAGATTVALEAQKVFATLEGRRPSLSSLSSELVQRLRTFLENKGPKDKLEYILATCRKLTDDELGYLDNVRVLGRSKFGDCFETDSISIETIYKKVLEEDEQPDEPGLSVTLHTTVSKSTDILLIGATTLPDVFAFMREYKANAFELLKTYAAGWLNEPGIAFGKNPPFAPGGSFFTKIVNEAGFNVESLYAAYQVQKLSNTYGFGRSAVHYSRGQTRYLFVMALIDLIKDHLVHLGKARSNPNATAAVVALADTGLLEHFGTAAVGVIDDYLTDGAEDSIFIEPEFQRTHDLNAFLKSERLGKSDEFSPNLRTQLALARKDFRRREHVGEINAVLRGIE